MSNLNLQKIEELSLSIFKIVVIALLSLTLIVVLGLLLKGVIDYTEKPDTPKPIQQPSPKKDPPQIGVESNQFLDQFLPKQPVPEQTDPLEKIVSEYIDKLWEHFNAYQKQCESPVLVDKKTFESTLPKQAFKQLAKQYGEAFLNSQNQFAKDVLGNQKLVSFCIEKKGKSGVFLALLNWHLDEWERQVKRNKKFIADEEKRIAQFEYDEKNRISEFNLKENIRLEIQKNDAMKKFWAALFGYGLFISLAILLIFARIAHNWLVRREIKDMTSSTE